MYLKWYKFAMRTLTFSEARSKLKEVLDTVADDADVTIITRRDAGDAVVMSLDTFNSWRETIYLLSNPANARHLARSIAELDASKGLVRTLVEPAGAPRVQEPRAGYLRKAGARGTGTRKPRSKSRG